MATAPTMLRALRDLQARGWSQRKVECCICVPPRVGRVWKCSQCDWKELVE